MPGFSGDYYKRAEEVTVDFDFAEPDSDGAVTVETPVENSGVTTAEAGPSRKWYDGPLTALVVGGTIVGLTIAAGMHVADPNEVKRMQTEQTRRDAAAKAELARQVAQRQAAEKAVAAQKAANAAARAAKRPR
jgi:hypothetical protein